MGIGAAIIGGSIVSGVLGSRSAGKQADVQAQAAAAGQAAQERTAQQSIEEQRRQFDITTEQLADAAERNRRLLRTGGRQAVTALEAGRAGQFEQLDPFAQAGVGALEQQQFLLGQGTPEQQSQAFSRLETAGSKFAREQSEKRALRTASATGGLGGGGVRAELERLRAGFDAQNFNTRFAQLGQLRTSGQQAAGDIGQGALATGSNIGRTRLGVAEQQGAGLINTAARQGQFGQATSGNISNILGQQGQAQQFALQQAGQARASGIAGQNQALQSGLGGVFTGAAASGLFSPALPQPGFTQPPGGQFSVQNLNLSQQPLGINTGAGSFRP